MLPYQALRTHTSQTSTLFCPAERNTNQVPSSTTVWEIVEGLSDIPSEMLSSQFQGPAAMISFLSLPRTLGTIIINRRGQDN